MVNKYQAFVSWSCSIEFDVEAENQEEAREKAEERAEEEASTDFEQDTLEVSVLLEEGDEPDGEECDQDDEELEDEEDDESDEDDFGDSEDDDMQDEGVRALFAVDQIGLFESALAGKDKRAIRRARNALFTAIVGRPPNHVEAAELHGC